MVAPRPCRGEQLSDPCASGREAGYDGRQHHVRRQEQRETAEQKDEGTAAGDHGGDHGARYNAVSPTCPVSALNARHGHEHSIEDWQQSAARGAA